MNEWIGRLAPVVLLVVGIAYSLLSQPAYPNGVVKTESQAIEIARHELGGRAPEFFKQPSHWQARLDGDRWTVRDDLVFGGGGELMIDARQGKIVEVRIYMAGPM